MQVLLVQQSKGPYFLGEQFSAADAAVAPFFQRFKVVLENGLGGYKAAEGRALLNGVFQDEKFSRFVAYLDALLNRESVKETFPAVWTSFLVCIYPIHQYHRTGLSWLIGSVLVRPSSDNSSASYFFPRISGTITEDNLNCVLCLL